jgi:hypothetical protein
MTSKETEYDLAHEGEAQKPATSSNPADPGVEKTTADSANFGPAPDGGLRAWLVAAGGACVLFSCLGFSNSFGVFVEYYITHQLQGQSPSKVAWIGSLSVFIQFAGGAIGGPMFDRYGAWVSAFCVLWVRFWDSVH